MALVIRDERGEDDRAIAQLVSNAFRDAPHAEGTEAEIVARLRSAGALAISLVATSGETIIGHIAFSPVAITGQREGWFGLGPVAVAPQRQGQGIGTQLIETGLDRLRTNGATGCVVLGEPGYYARFGFDAAMRAQLPGVPQEYFQGLHLGGGPLPGGTAQYHAAFC